MMDGEAVVEVALIEETGFGQLVDHLLTLHCSKTGAIPSIDGKQ